MYHIGLEIKNFNNVISRNIMNLKTLSYVQEITGSNGYILQYLVDHETQCITQKDIEATLGITRSTASTVLSRMEKKGLISRNILESDSRIKEVKITQKGKDIAFQIATEVADFERNILKGFKKEEVLLFLNFIKRMKENIVGGQNDD